MAKGCSQVLSCDFREKFTPVVKPATIWTILSIVVSKIWSIRQVDVNNAFLNGDFREEVYMQQPLGYVQYDANGRPLVCHLPMALYGLRQALQTWFDKLKVFLLSAGFVGSKSDASLFIRANGRDMILLLQVTQILTLVSLLQY